MEFDRDGSDRSSNPTVHRAPDDARRVEIHTLRVLLYTFNEGRLVHADVPGWLLRMMRNRNGRGSVYGTSTRGTGNRTSSTASAWISRRARS